MLSKVGKIIILKTAAQSVPNFLDESDAYSSRDV